MIITQQALRELNNSFSAAFAEGFKGAKPIWQMIAMMVASTGASNTYGWLGHFPRMREWVGDRVLKDLKAHAYTLENKSFESSIKVDRDQIEDDLTGTFGPILREMGYAAAIFPDELVFGALKLGVSQHAYDGQFFFDTDHPVYANVDGTGAATSVSNFTAGAGETWYLVDMSRSIKPIILQERRKAQFSVMNDLSDERVFTAKEYRWGVDGRWNAGYGLWQLAHASKAVLNKANFDLAYDAMCAVKADGGRPMAVNPTALVVPTTLRSAAEDVILKQYIAAGETNPNFKKVEVIVTPWLNG